MVMAHSLCYNSLTPSGRQLFQSPTLEVYGKNASCAAARIQDPLCWQTDCFVPAYCNSTTHLEEKGSKQGDGISESMDTSMESPGYNPMVNGMRTTTTKSEVKHPPLRNEFFRRKHKREQEEADAPARKKRLTEKMLDCLVTPVNVSCSSWPYTSNPLESGISDVASTSWQIGPSSQEFRVIENEAPYVEMKPDPSEEGLQKLKEIENRLVEGDDPEGDGIEVSDMPVLVLSDSLREELRPGLEEILPRRIMESLNHAQLHQSICLLHASYLDKGLGDLVGSGCNLLQVFTSWVSFVWTFPYDTEWNRPCMELVLWRPPCEPLSDKLAALPEQRNSKHKQPQCNSDVYNKSSKLDSSLMCGDMNPTNTSEEDMEL